MSPLVEMVANRSVPIWIIINFYILQFIYYNADSTGENLNCFNERFDSVTKSNISISEQGDLDDFVDSITSFTNIKDRCIQLFLTGESYTLDMVKIMRIKLGSDGGLVIVGLSDQSVKLNCVADASGLEDLRNSLKPLANVSLVVLDGLIFTECPVPVVLEEVSTVIVQNCVFM